MLSKKKLLVVLGPTATGKTDLALSLAKKFNGELVSCDSRQVYKGLDIGTGKLPGSNGQWTMDNGQWKKGKGFWEIEGVRIWMYDVVLLNKQYTVADYVKDADKVIKDITKKGKLPILVGGTGLYLKALLYGLPNLALPVDLQKRLKLNQLSKEQLQAKLQKLSPKRWNLMNVSDKQNPRRLIRAIEISLADHKPQSINYRPNYDFLKIGLNAARNTLYEKINKRVYQWIEDGISNEVKNLKGKGISKSRFKELGLEYSVALEYLDKKITLEEMINKMQTKVRQYAKRQLTWFKKDKDIVWFDISDEDYLAKVENLITKWYHQLKITKYAAKN